MFKMYNILINRIIEQMKCKYIKFIILVMFCLMQNVLSAHTANVISDIRTGVQDKGIRIVLEGSQNFNYDAFLLDRPNRLVIDIKNATIPKTPTIKSSNIIENFRVGDLSNTKGKRVVFGLKNNVNIVKKFILDANAQNKKYRLVIDLEVGATSNTKSNNNKNTTYYNPNKKKVIVLDPGHGGKDPGAIGAYNKTYEKNITLSMGKELKKHLEKAGFEVYMTRSTDIFIPLRKRVEIARNYHADLFISIHADSAKNKKAQGLSIYTLSEVASDKEAASLAESENKADIIDGMDFSDNSADINDVLISLSQNDSRNKSSKFSSYVVQEMNKKVKLMPDTHRFAGFAVLKAPDIPSVLLELGFLSNYTEEKYLRQPSYRNKLAEAVTKAVVRYFKDPEVASF